MVDALRPRLAPMPVEHGYLEFPPHPSRWPWPFGKGITRVLAIPAMLFAAGHAKNDIPSVEHLHGRNGLPIDYGRELGVDRLMVSAAGARVRECLDAAENDVPLAEPLVVAGRGSGSDANSNVAKVTRLLVEGLVWLGRNSFGRDSGGTGTATPWAGFRRVVVPYFLFRSSLTRIRQHTELVAADHPEVEFLSAGRLGDHLQVVDTFKERRGSVAWDTPELLAHQVPRRGTGLRTGRPDATERHHHVEGLGKLPLRTGVHRCLPARRHPDWP